MKSMVLIMKSNDVLERSIVLKECKEFNKILKPICSDNFENWYMNNVVRKRPIYCIKEGKEIIGILIFNRGDEGKINILWVAEAHRKTNLGTIMLCYALGQLDQFSIAIPKNVVDQYKPLLKRLELEITSYSNGHYYVN